jgi:hypothetical protein
MKKIMIILVVAITVFAGAFFVIKNIKSTGLNPITMTNSNTNTTQKIGTITTIGKISSTDGKFYLQEAGQIPREIDSYAIDLTKYVGQTITVSGQYSGDTLFVGSVTAE